MKKHEIKVGGHYVAKVNGKLTTVRVDSIQDVDSGMGAFSRYRYDVTNLRTGRKTTFRSAMKFRSVAGNPCVPRASEVVAVNKPMTEQYQEPNASEVAELAHSEATADRLLLEERAHEEAINDEAREDCLENYR